MTEPRITESGKPLIAGTTYGMDVQVTWFCCDHVEHHREGDVAKLGTCPNCGAFVPRRLLEAERA